MLILYVTSWLSWSAAQVRMRVLQKCSCNAMISATQMICNVTRQASQMTQTGLGLCSTPAPVLSKKKSHLGVNERKLQKAMEYVTSARAGCHVLMIELLVRPKFAKAKTNNPSLERLEVIWWQALITSLVFSDHDDTGPASAKHYLNKMLAKVGKEVCKFDLEEHLAIVMEFVL